VVRDEASIVEREVADVVEKHRRRREREAEIERPDRARRKQRRLEVVGVLRLARPRRRKRLLRARRNGARDRQDHDEGTCTTTSCGPRSRHPAIIALIFPPSVSHQTIIVLDFGSQYTQLIARRLRELSVYSEIWPPSTPPEKIRERRAVGIILSGGPKSVSEA